MNRYAPLVCAVLFAFACSAARTSAQTITSVVGSGGISASADNVRLAATIGQPAVGVISGVSTRLSQGFWFARTSASPSAVQEDRASRAAQLALSVTPNPFSQSTTLTFSVPETGHVSLVLFNAVGQQVRTVVDDQRQAGRMVEQIDLRDLPSGTYTAVLRVGDRRDAASLILVD